MYRHLIVSAVAATRDRQVTVTGHSAYALDDRSRFCKLTNKILQMTKSKMVKKW